MFIIMLTRLRYYHYFDFYVVPLVHHLYWTSDNSYSFVEVLLCKSICGHLTNFVILFMIKLFDKILYWRLISDYCAIWQFKWKIKQNKNELLWQYAKIHCVLVQLCLLSDRMCSSGNWNLCPTYDERLLRFSWREVLRLCYHPHGCWRSHLDCCLLWLLRGMHR